uniref:F-box domain-containing protein n=1 Tax=Arundo donax TaxID=35708 RepID=A0A0A9EGN4_ARUDO
MEAAGPWAGLPEELTDRIFSRLPSFVDRACCSGVCNSWRVAAMQREHAAPPLLPWLLRPSTAGASYFRVFSKTTTEQPVAHGARFCGSLLGRWFVIARSYALLNLLSGEEIPLPDGFGGHKIPVDLKCGRRRLRCGRARAHSPRSGGGRRLRWSIDAAIFFLFFGRGRELC